MQDTFKQEKLQDKDMPLVTLIIGKEWRPSEKEFCQWGISYPDTDFQGELRRMEDWLQKHPDRRKTERGMHTFVKEKYGSIKKSVAVLSASTAQIAADIKTHLMISTSDRNIISRS